MKDAPSSGGFLHFASTRFKEANFFAPVSRLDVTQFSGLNYCRSPLPKTSLSSSSPGHLRGLFFSIF